MSKYIHPDIPDLFINSHSIDHVATPESMASASMASTLFRNIKLGSVPRNRLESFKRSFGGGGGGGGGASYDVVLPHRTSPQVDPDAIPKQVWLPSYARTGRPDYGGRPNSAECHSEETVAKIRAACALAKALLTEVGMIIRPGMSTGVCNPRAFRSQRRYSIVREFQMRLTSSSLTRAWTSACTHLRSTTVDSPSLSAPR